MMAEIIIESALVLAILIGLFILLKDLGGEE